MAATDPSRAPVLCTLRAVALIEGGTLIALVLVAVPLKRLAGFDGAVTIIGPVHGAAFLVYLYAVVEAWGAGELTGWLAARALAAAMVPFGTWLNDRALSRRAAVLREHSDDAA
jgi:integral membrane protein